MVADLKQTARNRRSAMSAPSQSDPPVGGGNPGTGVSGTSVPNLAKGWSTFEKFVASGGVAILLAIGFGIHTITKQVTAFQVSLDHKLAGMATKTQLDQVRDVILARLDTHDEVLEDVVDALDSANKSVFSRPVNSGRIKEKLSRARAKTQTNLVWNNVNFLKPFEDLAFRQGDWVALLAHRDNTPVSAAAGGVVRVQPGEITLLLDDGGSSTATVRLAPAVALANSDVNASIVYRGISVKAVADGDRVTRGQTLGHIVRHEHSPMVAIKLLMQYRISGRIVPPPENLPELDLGLEIFELKCAGCHGVRSGGGPSLSELRLRKLPVEKVQSTLRTGKGKMPAFEKILSAEEESALVDYLSSKRTTLARVR